MMMLNELPNDSSSTHEDGGDFIWHNSDAPPISIPHGYVGPVYTPTGRLVWWTGRVAIGLRHRRPEHSDDVMTQSAHWLQRLVLGRGWKAHAA